MNTFFQDTDRLGLAVDILKALAHPLRVQMIQLLRSGKQLTVTDIQNELGIEQAVASHHLGILKSRDVLSCKRSGKNISYFVKDENVGRMIDLAMESVDE